VAPSSLLQLSVQRLGPSPIEATQPLNNLDDRSLDIVNVARVASTSARFDTYIAARPIALAAMARHSPCRLGNDITPQLIPTRQRHHQYGLAALSPAWLRGLTHTSPNSHPTWRVTTDQTPELMECSDRRSDSGHTFFLQRKHRLETSTSSLGHFIKPAKSYS
jgi:hypothetical protein